MCVYLCVRVLACVNLCVRVFLSPSLFLFSTFLRVLLHRPSVPLPVARPSWRGPPHQGRAGAVPSRGLGGPHVLLRPVYARPGPLLHHQRPAGKWLPRVVRCAYGWVGGALLGEGAGRGEGERAGLWGRRLSAVLQRNCEVVWIRNLWIDCGYVDCEFINGLWGYVDFKFINELRLCRL